MSSSEIKKSGEDSGSPLKDISKPLDFIRKIILGDLESGKHGGKVVTRFPPEPNGYLHIGHAKSICLNFGLAKQYEGKCHLRFDDTNPEKEDQEYMTSIQEDVRWMGFDWNNDLYHASDYFPKLYQFALDLISKGLAYVCELTFEQMREYRGTLKEAGKESPFRERTVQENLLFFEKMKNGEIEEGKAVLRAKINMASPNMNMRDPVIYRIKKVDHERTGDKWCLYPMYDFTHCISDALENITHSICTLEFEDHRPLYDWFLDHLDVPCHPQQIEFARLNLNYTVMSKRKLLKLVEEGYVDGWDDPRLPTLVGLRRRGYTPASIRSFCDWIGVAKKDSCIDMSILEGHLRDDLDSKAPRVMAVLDPLKVIIENYPEGKVETISAPYHPKKPEMGRREIPFSREIYIEKSDFMEDPPKKFHRLSVGKEVRLRYGHVIKCHKVVKDENGVIKELRCTYDVETLGGKTPDGRKVKGIIHWLSAKQALKAEIRLYDRLFILENPGAEENFCQSLNPESLKILNESYVEPVLKNTPPESYFQFERQGYFCSDRYDSCNGQLVFNRAVTLKDSWAKLKVKN